MKDDISSCLTEGNGGTYIDIEVSPDSSQTVLDGYNQWRDTIELSLNERAEDGEANRALISFLSDILNTEESDLTIAKGKRSKRKRMFVGGKSKDFVMERLSSWMKE